MAGVDRRSQRLLEALCIRELLAPVESDGMDGLSLERPLCDLVDLGMGLPGGLAADKASAHPVDLGDEACAAPPASDRIAFPVACPAPGRCLFRPLGDAMGHAHLAPALLASLPVPALSMVPERPCGLLVPRKPAVWGSRPHGTVDGGIARGEVGPLLRDAARCLLRGPAPVPHGPHDWRAPLGFVHGCV